MTAALHLLAGQIENAVVILFKDHFFEIAAALGVQTFSNEEGGRLLLHGLVLDGGRQNRCSSNRACRRFNAVYLFHQQFQVLRGRAAAAAHHADAMFGGEFIKGLGEGLRFQRIDGLSIHI